MKQFTSCTFDWNLDNRFARSSSAAEFFQSSRCATKVQELGDLWPVTLCEFSPMHSRCFYPRRTLCSGLLAWKSCLQWTVWLCKCLGTQCERTGGGVAGLLQDTCCCVFPLFKLTCNPLTSLSFHVYLHRTKLLPNRTLCICIFLLVIFRLSWRSVSSVELMIGYNEGTQF